MCHYHPLGRAVHSGHGLARNRSPSDSDPEACDRPGGSIRLRVVFGPWRPWQPRSPHVLRGTRDERRDVDRTRGVRLRYRSVVLGQRHRHRTCGHGLERQVGPLGRHARCVHLRGHRTSGSVGCSPSHRVLQEPRPDRTAQGIGSSLPADRVGPLPSRSSGPVGEACDDMGGQRGRSGYRTAS